MGSTKSKTYWIKVIVSLAIFFIIALCPCFGPMTREEMYALAAFISCIVSWVSGVDAWLSLVLIIIYSLFVGESFGTTVFSGMMGSYTVWLVFSMFWFIAAIRDSGLFSWIASKMMSLKICKKGPYWLMFMFIFAAWLVTAIVQTGAPVFVFLATLLKQISDQLNLKKYNMWTVMTGCGIAAACCFGNLLFPFNWVTQLYFNLFTSTIGIQELPGDLPYFLVMLVGGLLAVVLIVLFTKFIIRPKVDMSNLAEVDMSSKEKLNKTMVGTIIAIAALVIIMVGPYLLPDGWFITVWMNNLGTPGAFIIAAIIQCFVKDRNGEPLFNFREKVKNSTEISMMLCLAPILYVGDIVNSTTGGLTQIFQNVFSPLSSLPFLPMIIVLGIICVIMTNYTNNFLPCFITGPIALAVVGYDGKWAAIVAVVMLFNAFTAIAFPSAGTIGILIHGEKETFKSSQIILWGMITSVIASIACSIAVVIFQGMF